jgi:CheY-like chemotaxis protein
MNVLIVDDDDGVRDSLGGFLESEGHTFRIAKDGMEALTILKNDQPDLIIADISMPKMTGIELTRHIRTEYRDRTTEILLVSGHQPSKRELRSMAEMGVSEFLKKPINAQKLNEYLRSKQPCQCG